MERNGRERDRAWGFFKRDYTSVKISTLQLNCYKTSVWLIAMSLGHFLRQSSVSIVWLTLPLPNFHKYCQSAVIPVVESACGLLDQRLVQLPEVVQVLDAWESAVMHWDERLHPCSTVQSNTGNFNCYTPKISNKYRFTDNWKKPKEPCKSVFFIGFMSYPKIICITLCTITFTRIALGWPQTLISSTLKHLEHCGVKPHMTKRFNRRKFLVKYTQH